MQELADYRKKGPGKTTRVLIDAIKASDINGKTLLDIGGGVGAVQHALLENGVQTAVDVDASQAYLNAAQTEAFRRGIADRIQFEHGNFLDLAGQVSTADIVTLDRVICCYDDMENLVDLSAARAGELYGVVFPRDTWWIKLGVKILNLVFRLQRHPFRTFVHPTRSVEALVNRHGLKRRFHYRTLVWQVIVYSRS